MLQPVKGNGKTGGTTRSAAVATLAAKGISAARKVEWKLVWARAQWLLEHGRRVFSNLTERERSEIKEILVKSKGRPANVTQRERDRVQSLVRKAFLGFK